MSVYYRYDVFYFVLMISLQLHQLLSLQSSIISQQTLHICTINANIQINVNKLNKL